MFRMDFQRIKRIVKRLVITLVIIYVVLLAFMYLFQEKFIFHPKKFSPDYKFTYAARFKEYNIETKDKKHINALLFQADTAKGLVFYLHGNSGAIDTWGFQSDFYNKLHYDFFIMDYRGFGKSEGDIESEEQFFSDVQLAYDEMKKIYGEDRIIVIGYSIGTGPAAMLAAKNKPKHLILKAPYYSLIDMMHQRYSFVPDFILNYKLETFNYLPQAKMPVTIFHGTNDGVIYYGSSLRLKEKFKKGDTLFTLEGQRHNGINENEIYKREVKRILEQN